MQNYSVSAKQFWEDCLAGGPVDTHICRVFRANLRLLTERSPGFCMGASERVQCQGHGRPSRGRVFFSEWDEDKLSEILSTQRAVVKHQKAEKASNKIFLICVVVDDFADDQRVMASRTGSGGSAINLLLTCGRHISCSCMLSSQKQKAVGSIARINAQALIIFRLRSKAELDAIIEELSNFYPRKILLQMYELAVNDQPYSFWYQLGSVEK